MALVLVATAFVATLQTDWARSKIRIFVEQRVSDSLDGGTLTIGDLEGNLIFHLAATDLRLFSGDSLVVSVDSLRSNYSLLSVLAGDFRIYDLHVVRPSISARQLPDSTWDLLNLVRVDSTAADGSTKAGFRIDALSITDGSGFARFAASGPDSSIYVQRTSIVGRDVYFASGHFGSTIDDLAIVVVAPVATDPVTLTASGELAEDRLTCVVCRLESVRSSVEVGGYVLWSTGASPRADLNVRLEPLALGDIAFALPQLDTKESVVGEIHAKGSVDSLWADLTLDFAGGAAARLNGTIRSGQHASIKIDGSIASFDPGLFLPDAGMAGSVNATVDVDLNGRELQALSGPISFRIFDTILNEVSLRDGYLSGRFDGGTASIDSRFYLPGIALAATGSLAPFADTVSYDLNGSIRAAGLSRHYPASSEIDELDAAFELAGKGISIDESIVHATMNVNRLSGRRLHVGSSSAVIDVNMGEVAVKGRVGLRDSLGEDAGTIAFAAQLASTDEVWRIDADNLQITDLDLQSIVNGAPSGLLSASGDVELELARGSVSRAAGSASVSGSLGLVALSEAGVVADFADGQGTYQIGAATDIGGIDVRGSIVERGTGYEIAAKGRVTHLNLDTLTTFRLATDLTGAFHATTFVSEAGATSLSLDARLESSVVNEQILTAAVLEAALADGSLTFDVDIDLPNGGLSADGWGRPFDDDVSVHLTNGAFRNVNLGAWLDEDILQTDLNGSVSARLQGSGIDADFRLKSSRINRSDVEDGSLTLSLSDSTFRLDSSIDVGDGKAVAILTGQFVGADTTYQGMIRLRNVDAAGLAGVDSLYSNLNIGCSFVGTDFRWPGLEASAYCTGRRSRLGAALVDSLRFEAKLDKEVLALTEMTLESNIGRITGSGLIPTRAEKANSRSEIDLTVELEDLAPAAQLVGAEKLDGEGRLTITVGGSLESPSFSTEAALSYLSYDQYRVSSIDGFAQMSDFSEGHLIAAVDIGFSVFNDVPVQHTSFEVEKTGNTLFVTGDTRIDSRRNGRFSARYDQQGNGGTMVVDALNLNLEGEIWGLSEEAAFEIGDVWSVKTFLLFSDDQQIALDGYIDPDGEQNLIVTLEQLRLGAFTDLVGYQGVDGIGEGYVVVTGAYDDLQLESSIRVQTLKTYGREVGDFDISATYDDAQMNVDGRLSHSTGSTLTMRGFVPIRLSMTGLDDLDGIEPIQLEVKSDSVPLAWIRPFLDQTIVDRIEGNLVCDVTVAGTWDEPLLSGSAQVAGGRIRLPEFKLDMRSIRGVFRLDGEQLLVDDFVADSKGGTLTASGTVGFRSLDDPTFDVNAKLNKFRAISTETYHLTVSGDTRLTGSMIRPVFRGKVFLEDSDIFMTEELMADEVDPVRLTNRDLRILERRFGYRVAVQDTTTWDFYEALDLNLETRIGRDVWLRSYSNPKMDIEFSGDMTISKAPLRDEVLSGTINVNPSRSRVIQFARKFEIQSGTIQFNGVVEEALVDLKAQYVVPSRFGGDEVKINLGISGKFDDMRLELTSDPQMDTGAMASYLATGRPPGEGSVGGTQAAELAVSGLSNLVEGFANSELGLDVVEIQVSATNGTYLKIGKYMSPRIYVSLTQPLLTNDSYQGSNAAHQTEMAIEYELISWLVAQIGSSRNQLLVNMIWEFTF